jgi:hypothetical protein
MGTGSPPFPGFPASRKEWTRYGGSGPKEAEMARVCMSATLALLLLGTACGEDVYCLQGSYPAVLAQVTSAADGSPLLGALGVVREGGYRDSLSPLGDGQYAAAYDRGGVYAVHIEREGYAPWDTTGITVSETGGACSTVETEQVEARLGPI